MTIKMVFVDGIPLEIENRQLNSFAYHCKTKCTTWRVLLEQLCHLVARDDLQLVVT